MPAATITAIAAVLGAGSSIYGATQSGKGGKGSSGPDMAWVLGSLGSKAQDAALRRFAELPDMKKRIAELYKMSPSYRKRFLEQVVGQAGKAAKEQDIQMRSDLASTVGVGSPSYLNRLAKLREVTAESLADKMIQTNLGLDDTEFTRAVAGIQAERQAENDAMGAASSYAGLYSGMPFAQSEEAPRTDWSGVLSGVGQLVGTYAGYKGATSGKVTPQVLSSPSGSGYVNQPAGVYRYQPSSPGVISPSRPFEIMSAPSFKAYGDSATTDRAMFIGDSQRAGVPNPELVLNPTGAPLTIVPVSNSTVKRMGAPRYGCGKGKVPKYGLGSAFKKIFGRGSSGMVPEMVMSGSGAVPDGLFAGLGGTAAQGDLTSILGGGGFSSSQMDFLRNLFRNRGVSSGGRQVDQGRMNDIAAQNGGVFPLGQMIPMKQQSAPAQGQPPMRLHLGGLMLPQYNKGTLGMRRASGGWKGAASGINNAHKGVGQAAWGALGRAFRKG